MSRDHPALSLAARTAVVSIATLVGIVFLTMPMAVSAQVSTVRSNTFGVNGRPVQEIRIGVEPGPSPTQIRMVVVTNGPVAGTTTLLTAVVDANALLDSAVPAPTFTPIIASGTVFSVGGGCTRGNQVEFPFINGNRPKILRFVAGNPTVIDVATSNSALYDSAECVVSGDGTETYSIFTQRTGSILELFRDRGAADDLAQALVGFSSTRTPFAGGLRPAISIMPGTARTVALLAMSTNGQSRWRQFNVNTTTTEFNCLAGVQSPAPIGFTIPRGGVVLGKSAFSDFDNNGVFDRVTIDPTVIVSCTAAPVATAAGAVSGSLFNWTEPGAALSQEILWGSYFATETTFQPPVGDSYSVPGPHAGKGGPHAACSGSNTEVVNAFLSAGVDTPTTIKLAQTNDTTVRPPAPGQDYIYRSSFDRDTDLTNLACRDLGRPRLGLPR